MDSQENIQQEFGRRLRLLRKKRGLSQEKLAELCDLDRTYVSSVDKGRRNISLYNIWRLAENLGLANPSAFFVSEAEFEAQVERLESLKPVRPKS